MMATKATTTSPSPFDQYIAAVTGFYTGAVEHAKKSHEIADRTQELDDLEKQAVEAAEALDKPLLHKYAPSKPAAPNWGPAEIAADLKFGIEIFRRVRRGVDVAGAFSKLIDPNEWFEPMKRWARTGDDLARALQEALARYSGEAEVLTRQLVEHTARYPEILKEKVAQTSNEEAAQKTLSGLLALVDASDRFPPLADWNRKVQQFATTVLQREIGQHEPSVSSIPARAEDLRRQHTQILHDYQQLERSLSQSASEALSQRNKLEENLTGANLILNEVVARRRGNITALALILGTIGAIFGMSIFVQWDSAGFGFILGSLVGASLGIIIGLLAGGANIRMARETIAGVKSQQVAQDRQIHEANRFVEELKSLKPARLRSKS